ncbi:c-type cytochrome [Mesorhizobium sp. YR577]|uniref:c-type cytochrome n=1 Tax=Mesorhizobium sp. YR577 TaxID=1884373 RepID=UPI0008E1914C|nr:c-type cytochrome [Mesorhizobium sp. YR577]SFU21282.1 Cytochrome c553 [Mesorhizobium sp. YR577]
MFVRWWHMVLVLVVAPLAVILFAWIGFFNVGASTGHWKITEWFLHFAMQSAVRTYALSVEVPDELPRAGVQPAAAHFATGCAICHGAPGELRSPVVKRMLPQPPDLTTVVDKWSDAELFRIVKHGVRFTGMPAWPNQARDDEIWAMVAFLRELPSLDPQQYRELAHGSTGLPSTQHEGFERVLADCVRCHETNGAGRSALTPIIAGQSEAYLLESLRAYAEGRRASGFMAQAAANVDPDGLERLARYFAAQSPPAPDSAPANQAASGGREIAERGLSTRRVPACLGCHGGSAQNPAYPKLWGQRADYIEAQLRLFREGKRSGTAYSHLMLNAAKNLTDEDIKAVATYFAAQTSGH